MKNVSISKEALWAMISSMSNDNKRWLANKLIENTPHNTQEVAKQEVLKEIAEGLNDVKEGYIFPARDLFKHLEDE